ncbi:MAG: TatD family hydrolase [Thioalkalispiraceae bacterium]|jgi:TatD DNase family protein
MDLIDSHCHIDVADFDADRDEVLSRCRQQGIHSLIVPAIDVAGWDKLLSLCDKEQGLYPALGLHPVFLDQHQQGDVEKLEAKLATTEVVAVGEIGLDFYIKELDRDEQMQFFEAQLAIAANLDLPVILHVRKAHEDVLASLKKYKVKGGVSHAFNGSLQQAQQYLDMGFKLGFGGTMTYKGSHKIHQLARQLPLEAIVLETDAPDMVVASHRGERNSPEYLVESLKALAQLRDEDINTVAAQTTANAREVFGLDS